MWSFLLDWYSKFINKHPNHNENNVSFEFRGTDSPFWWKLQTSHWFFSGAACRPSTSFVEDAMYRIEIIKDMSRCFCLDKTAHRPSTQSNHQYFHFSKFREHQQSETALWRRLFLLVLVFNIYSPKFWWESHYTYC